MKRTIKIEKEVDIFILSVEAGVRHWEDATVNGVEDTEGDLIPCRRGELWCPSINIDTGIITNWNKGTSADIHYKVCDAGTYTLKDEEGNTLAKHDGYVRNIMSPEGGGYGDYIIMHVDENGYIKNWNPNVDDFFEED